MRRGRRGAVVAAVAVLLLTTGATLTMGAARARTATATTQPAPDPSGEGAGSVGVAQVIRPPIGNVDLLQPLGVGQLLLAGWAADPDEGELQPRIDVYVGGPYGVGVGRSYGLVDRYRPDVAAVYGGRLDRGFALVLTDLAPGPVTVCAYGIGRAPSAASLLGCHVAAAPARGPHDPFGTLDLVDGLAERAVRAQGWAVDPDDPTAPVEVRVQALQTTPAGSALLGVPADPCRGPHGCTLPPPLVPDDDKDTDASRPRPDVGAAFPGVGAAHGFDHTVTRQEYRPSPLPFDTARLEPGVPTRVCAWARNRGPGADTLLGCRWVEVAPPSSPALNGQIYVPRASADPPAPGVVAVEGWATRAGPGGAPEVDDLQLQVTIGGPRGVGEARDLGPVAGLPGSGGAFATAVGGVAAGRSSICAYVLDPPTARSVLVACWYATVT